MLASDHYIAGLVEDARAEEGLFLSQHETTECAVCGETAYISKIGRVVCPECDPCVVMELVIDSDLFNNIRTVIVPSSPEHNGIYKRWVRLVWVCPVCGMPRGEPREGTSIDGSIRMSVSVWENACGHVDKYTAVINEAIANGLNHVQEEKEY